MFALSVMRVTLESSSVSWRTASAPPSSSACRGRNTIAANPAAAWGQARHDLPQLLFEEVHDPHEGNLIVETVPATAGHGLGAMVFSHQARLSISIQMRVHMHVWLAGTRAPFPRVP